MPEPSARARADTLLGFDYGEKRIGVAVGERDTGLCHPLDTLPCRDGRPDWAAIKALIGQWRPAALVVGVPRHMDGAASAMTARAERFSRQLAGRSALPVHCADERATSLAARALLGENRRRGRRRALKSDVDRVAATLILQAFLDEGARR